MKNTDNEPQLWADMNDQEEDNSQITLVPIISMALCFIFGIFFGIHTSNKKHAEEASLKNQQVQSNSSNPGSFVIFRNNANSITFNGFEGELVWYESYEGSHFHPIGHITIKDKKPIQVPQKARAFLKKGKVLGETYSMNVTYNP